ncbi:hypothetical protein AKJ65_01515 [candidate division MSBL1 archaeon SCGC-AAA259E19]|uniref:Uncharacterized protein n=1 Tax=candidate division MSBL1 archaeon SCGC-AAA259E19 TaxID=1698264 RepID=A0A133UN58_9EURY|nr:hypothetical protein AKJ65_01515 [candidate division MSBL1 archaeon SCGC-AAA259E19]
MRKELERIREVNGDVDLWIERKAQELEAGEAGGEPEEKVTKTTTREGARGEERGIDPSELFGEVEPDESELSEKEKYFQSLEDEFSATQNDIIRCTSKGINNSRKIAQKLNLNPDTVRRNYKPLREEELLETGRKGISLTERGKQFAEHLTEDQP